MWYCTGHTYVLAWDESIKARQRSEIWCDSNTENTMVERKFVLLKVCFFHRINGKFFKKFVLLLTRGSEVSWHEGSCSLGAKYMVAPLFPCSTLIHQDIILFSFATMIEETINQRQSPNFLSELYPSRITIFFSTSAYFSHIVASLRALFTPCFCLFWGTDTALQPRLLVLHNAKTYRLS